MKTFSLVVGTSLLLGAAGSLSASDEPLRPAASIEISSSKGSFDFLRVDSKRHRLLAAHERDGTADYFDLDNNRLIGRVKVGAAVDHAVDADSQYYYVSVQKEQRVAVIDAASLKQIESIQMEGPTDAILFEPKNHMVYVTHDDGANVWIIDPAGRKVTGSIAIPGTPEYMVYDALADRIYLNIKSANVVAVIDPNANEVVATWPTAPAISVHGLALDSEHHRVYSAGANGQLAVIDTQNGRVVSSVKITEKVDQIAFDPKSHTVYCAGPNTLSVIRTSGENPVAGGDLATAASAKNVAVDPITGAVWTTYTDGKSAYAKSWTQ